MVQKAKSGHPGGAMGAADATTLLFAEFLRFDPDDPEWMGRDRFFMDPGHMSPLLYSELVLTGRLTLDDVKNFRQLGSRTPGHPELDVMLGIENSSGPLGIGHGIALGAAIAERFMVERFGSILEHKTVCSSTRRSASFLTVASKKKLLTAWAVSPVTSSSRISSSSTTRTRCS